MNDGRRIGQARAHLARAAAAVAADVPTPEQAAVAALEAVSAASILLGDDRAREWADHFLAIETQRREKAKAAKGGQHG